MQYGITQRMLGNTVFVDLSKESYEEAKNARSNLMECLFIEEKYDYVVNSLYEYEREILNVTLDHQFFIDRSWSETMVALHGINRRIVNLLTTGRLYLDQVPHNIRQIYGRKSQSPLETLFTRTKSEEYDKHLEYRAMEVLRNYVQHRGFPIHGVNTNAGTAQDARKGVKYVVTPYIGVEELATDGKCKSAILEELRAIGSKLDVKPLIREYVDCIGRIHFKIREKLKPDVAKWKKTIENVKERFRNAGGNDTCAVALVATDDSNKAEYIEVFDDFIKRYEELGNRNKGLTHFANQFVSSEVLTEFQVP